MCEFLHFYNAHM